MGRALLRPVRADNPFDTEIDADPIQASFRNGALTVELPQERQAKRNLRGIEIKPS